MCELNKNNILWFINLQLLNEFEVWKAKFDWMLRNNSNLIIKYWWNADMACEENLKTRSLWKPCPCSKIFGVLLIDCTSVLVGLLGWLSYDNRILAIFGGVLLIIETLISLSVRA